MSGRHSFPAKQTPNKGDYICQSAAIRYKYSCVFTAAAAVFFIIYLSRRRFISRLLRDAGWSHRGVDRWYKQENTSDVIAVHLPHVQLNRNHETQPLFIILLFIFFLKNNTNNIKWKRLLKIITMLQVPRFDNLKEEKHIYTKVYIYILIFIFKGYGQEEQSGRRPLI